MPILSSPRPDADPAHRASVRSSTWRPARLLRWLVTVAVVAASTNACGNGERASVELGLRFDATAEHPFTFRYPAAWAVGDEAEGELAIGVEDSVVMVLEPVHPWAGLGGFTGRAERMEVDGYEAYRMALGGDHAEGKGLAFRIDAAGTDVSLWFFAQDPAAYDEGLFTAIVETLDIDEQLLGG